MFVIKIDGKYLVEGHFLTKDKFTEDLAKAVKFATTGSANFTANNLRLRDYNLIELSAVYDEKRAN